MTVRHGVVLIDDEVLARRRIRQLLSTCPDFDVVAESGDAREVAALVRATRPAVAFLDINMPHLDGFAVEAAIRAHVAHVVFVTAHAEHAARGFDVAASDYLVKPVTRTRFDAALDRLRRSLSPGRVDRVLLGSRQGGTVADVAEVRWVEARGAYAFVHTADRRHVLRASLGQMQARLGGRFLRVHRSALVNVDRVQRLHRTDAGLSVELSDGRRLPVSRRLASLVVAALGPPSRDRSKPGPAARIGAD